MANTINASARLRKTYTPVLIESNGGSDGARTRDLRRDRPSVYLTISAVVPTFSAPGQAHFDAKSERPITGIPGRSCAAGSIQADGKALPARSHAERPVQASLCD